MFGDMDEDGFFYVSGSKDRHAVWLQRAMRTGGGGAVVPLGRRLSSLQLVFALQGDLNGHRGLVPSNFLQALPEDLPAERASAQPAPEPRREPQVRPLLSDAHGRSHPGQSAAAEKPRDMENH